MTTSKGADAVMIFVPVGLVLGLAAGVWLDDMTTGVVLGFLTGSTAGAFESHKKGKLAVIWPALGAIGFAWILLLTLVHRS